MRKWASGFTLVELIIVIAIIAVVAGLSTLILSGQNSQSTLNGTTSQIVASLRQTQVDSSYQSKNATWGIHFSNATNTPPYYALVIVASSSCTASNQCAFGGTCTAGSCSSGYTNASVMGYYPLPATIGYVTSTLPAGSSQDVIFSAISGASSISTTISLYALSQPSVSSSIVISASGMIGTGSTYVAGGGGSSSSTTQHLWIVDVDTNGQEGHYNEFVNEYDLNGNFITQFGQHGSAPWGQNGEFFGASGITVASSGDIYVSQVIGTTYYIQVFSPTSTYMFSFAQSGSANGKVSAPYDLASNAAGNIYVSDVGNNRIQVFSPSGTYVTKFGVAGTGNGDFNGDLGGLAVDANGNTYAPASNSNRVEKFNASGTYVSQLGGCSSGACAAGSSSNQFDSPLDVAVDPSGNVYVVDFWNNRVSKFNASGTYQYQLGCLSGLCAAGSSTGQFGNLAGVITDANGNVYVGDTGNGRIEKFDSNGNYVTQFGNSGNASSGLLYAPNFENMAVY